MTAYMQSQFDELEYTAGAQPMMWSNAVCSLMSMHIANHVMQQMVVGTQSSMLKCKKGHHTSNCFTQQIGHAANMASQQIVHTEN